MTIRPFLPARSGRGAPVIALHSSGASGRQWEPLALALLGSREVIAPDLSGHGRGPLPPFERPSVVAADAALVAGLARSVRGGVHLVGHSYGGAIALKVALEHPDAVHSVAAVEPVMFRVLFDRYGRRRPAAEVLDTAQAIRRLVRARLPLLAAERFVGYWGGPAAWAALGADAKEAVAARMGTIAAHFDALAADSPSLADCARIVQPVLLLAGTRTRAPTAHIVELLASALPDARAERLPGGDHVEALSSPARIVARIASFLGRSDDAGSHRWRTAA